MTLVGAGSISLGRRNMVMVIVLLVQWGRVGVYFWIVRSER